MILRKILAGLGFGGALGLALALAACQGCGTAGRGTENDAPGAQEPNVVKIASEADFKAKVEDVKGLVLADFYADWCGYCKKLAPVVEKLSGEYAGRVAFVKVNVDELKGLAKRFKVEALPTVILFKDGQPVETLVGYRDEDELKKVLDKRLKE